MELNRFPSRLPLQLRFSDVDVLGHVNNTVYFAFFDTGKAAFFTDLRGLRADWQNVDTVIANVNCAFVNPIFFRDKVEIFTRVSHVGNKSFKLEQVIVEVVKNEVKAQAETVMVCIDPETKESRVIPDEFRAQLLASLENL